MDGVMQCLSYADGKLKYGCTRYYRYFHGFLYISTLLHGAIL